MDHPSISSLAEELANIRRISRVFDYGNLASFVIVYFDWLLNFDSEVKLIWKASRVKPKILYLLVRYLPLAYSPPYLYSRFGNLAAPGCTTLYITVGTIFTLTAVFGVLVITLRTWAVWGMTKPMTYLLFGSYIAASVVILSFFSTHLKYTTQIADFHGVPLGCIPKHASPYLPAAFLTDASYETVILLLMLVRGVSLYQFGGNSRLFQTLYRDGIMFYVYMTGVSVANVVLLFSKSDYHVFMMPIQGAIRAISACRIILHIRMQVDEMEMPGSTTLTTLNATQDI